MTRRALFVLALFAFSRLGSAVTWDVYVADPDNCLIKDHINLEPGEYWWANSGPFNSGGTIFNLWFAGNYALHSTGTFCDDLGCGSPWVCSGANAPTPATKALFNATDLSGGGIESGLVQARDWAPVFSEVQISENIPREVCLGGFYDISISAKQGGQPRNRPDTPDDPIHELTTKVYFPGNNSSTPDYQVLGRIDKSTANHLYLPGVTGTARIEIVALGCGCMEDRREGTQAIKIQVEDRQCLELIPDTVGPENRAPSCGVPGTFSVGN